MGTQQLATISDLAFQATMAAYLVGLICFGIEVASRRGADAVAPAVSRVRTAVGVGSVALAERSDLADGATPGTSDTPGGDDPANAVPSPGERRRVDWGEQFGRAAVVVTSVGVLANLISVVTRGLAAGRLPLANVYEFSSFLALVAVATMLVVRARMQARGLGMFVLVPITVLTFLAGTLLWQPVGPVVPSLNSYWKWVHVTTISLSGSVLLVSGAASVMYLMRHRHDRRVAEAAESAQGAPGQSVDPTRGDLDHRALADAGSDGALDSHGELLPARRSVMRAIADNMPSAALLDKIAYRTAIVAFPVYTFAIIAGALWAEVAWGRYWGWDPKETVAFVSWVFYAGYLHARATAGWRGVRAAWINVIGFAAIVFNLFFINYVVSGLHSYAS